MPVKNCMMASNDMLHLRHIANYHSYVVTKTEEDTTVRGEIYGNIKGGVVGYFHWVCTSLCLNHTVTVLLLGLDYPNLGSPDDNLGRREGLFVTRKMLNEKTLGHGV